MAPDESNSEMTPACALKSPHIAMRAFNIRGAQRRNRTTDTIFNPLLYRLSYLGVLLNNVVFASKWRVLNPLAGGVSPPLSRFYLSLFSGTIAFSHVELVAAEEFVPLLGQIFACLYVHHVLRCFSLIRWSGGRSHSSQAFAREEDFFAFRAGEGWLFRPSSSCWYFCRKRCGSATIPRTVCRIRLVPAMPLQQHFYRCCRAQRAGVAGIVPVCCCWSPVSPTARWLRQTDEYWLNMQVIVAEGMAEGRKPLLFIIPAVMIELFLQQLPGLLYVLRFRKSSINRPQMPFLRALQQQVFASRVLNHQQQAVLFRLSFSVCCSETVSACRFVSPHIVAAAGRFRGFAAYTERRAQIHHCLGVFELCWRHSS